MWASCVEYGSYDHATKVVSTVSAASRFYLVRSSPIRRTALAREIRAAPTIREAAGRGCQRAAVGDHAPMAQVELLTAALFRRWRGIIAPDVEPLLWLQRGGQTRAGHSRSFRARVVG